MVTIPLVQKPPPSPTFPALPVCGCGASGVAALVRVAVFAVVVAGAVRSMSGWRGRVRAGGVVLGLRGSCSVGAGLSRTSSSSPNPPRSGGFWAAEDALGPARTLSAGQGRPRRGQAECSRTRFEPPRRRLTTPERQAWLHLAADGSAARKRVHLERHFAVCNATSGLTTPVNRLLKAPGVYSRALSSVVNVQPAHQTPHPTPCHVPGHRQHSCPSPRHHTPKPEEPLLLSARRPGRAPQSRRRPRPSQRGGPPHGGPPRSAQSCAKMRLRRGWCAGTR